MKIYLIHMKKPFIIATVVMSLLAGRTLGPEYRRPPIKTPDEFRGHADRTSPRGCRHSIGDLKWFEVFQDEALQKLVRTAMDQNYDLRLAVSESTRRAPMLASLDQINSRSSMSVPT